MRHKKETRKGNIKGSIQIFFDHPILRDRFDFI